MEPIYNAIGWLLALFYGLIPNLGVAIILLTVTVMLILFPLTAKQARSMIAMQRLQPEIKKLQAKYKGDRQKLNEELMKFYQENKVNPLAGCLPLLVQMPIFFALFNVLRHSEDYVPASSDLYAALCGSQAVSDCDPKGLSFLSMDLSVSALDSHSGFLDALPYFLLVALVVVTGILQARQTQKNSAGANPQMLMVGRVLPIMFGLFSLQFPAGLVLYFFTSNLWRLGQQELILRRWGPARPATGVVDARSKDVTGKPPPGGTAGGGGILGRLMRPATPADGAEPVEPVEPVEPPKAPPPAPRPASGAAKGSTRPRSSRNKRRRR